MSLNALKKQLLIAALAAAAYLGLAPAQRATAPQLAPAPPATQQQSGSADALENAYRQRLRHHQLSGSGTVIKLLADDNAGSKHQRFVLHLNSGRTLLVSHNIDLAERIDTLQVGDTVAFYGEYEWNAQGGVVHWTHPDPQGQHTAGWIEHAGRRYQ